MHAHTHNAIDSQPSQSLVIFACLHLIIENVAGVTLPRPLGRLSPPPLHLLLLLFQLQRRSQSIICICIKFRFVSFIFSQFYLKFSYFAICLRSGMTNWLWPRYSANIFNLQQERYQLLSLAFMCCHYRCPCICLCSSFCQYLFLSLSLCLYLFLFLLISFAFSHSFVYLSFFPTLLYLLALALHSLTFSHFGHLPSYSFSLNHSITSPLFLYLITFAASLSFNIKLHTISCFSQACLKTVKKPIKERTW